MSGRPTHPDTASPSAWSRRAPVLVLALAGCAISTYLTLFQWHLTSTVWDPIFGAASSEAVLTSVVSQRLPVPDATLGAVAYAVEAVLTALGGSNRWHRHPWLVLLYGLTLAGLAVVSVALVLTQAFVVHAFCSLCLCSAGISWVNAWLGHDEVVASLQHVRGGAHDDKVVLGGAHTPSKSSS